MVEIWVLLGAELTIYSSEKDLSPAVNVLVVSFSFPPQAEVGGIRVSQFCKYLPENGIAPTVLTSTPESYESIDETIPIPAGIEVVRAPIHRTPLDLYREISSLKRRLTRSSSSAAGQEVTAPKPAPPASESRLRLHVETLLQTPDRYWGWYRQAVRDGSKIISAGKIDVIFSSGPPFICHLIARRLHRKHNLPWAADFRDPWASNEIATRQPAWRRAMDRKWEASCIEESSLVVCNTDRLRARFTQQYPNLPPNKFVSLTNGFMDSTAAPDDSVGTEEKWLHTGELYSSRRIDTFCQALHQLSQEKKVSLTDFHIDFYGGIEPRLHAVALHSAPELFDNQVIRFHSRVPWAESQKLLRKARLLLLFQGTFHAQTPAKVYEYLSTGIPIFAVAKKGSLTDLIDMTGSGVWADPEDVDDIKAKLIQCLAMPVRRPEDVRLRLPELHYSSLTRRLAGWMKQLAGASPKEEDNSVHLQSAQLS